MLRNKLHVSLFGLALVVVIAAVGFYTRQTSTITHAAQQVDYEIIASLPVGDGGVHYENAGAPEMEVTGPASFRVARNGTFLVADTATNRILSVSRGGVIDRDIHVPDAGGIVDLAVGPSGEILALDVAQQAVHRINQGRPNQKNDLPDSFRGNGLSGIASGRDGEPVLELKGASKLVKSTGDEIRAQALYGQDIFLEVPDLGNAGVDSSTGGITIGEKSARINVPNLLAGLKVLGIDKKGGLFISVLEMTDTPAVQVDETIYHYDKDLNLLEKARVPLAERYTYTQRGVDVDENGNVFAMIPRVNKLDIVKLSFKQDLRAALPKADSNTFSSPRDVLRAHASRSVVPQTACSRTRTQMSATANGYVNNSTYLSSTNLNGYCAGRTAPRYLGTSAGYKRSVAYDWGGSDGVSSYNTYMTQGYKAGNINTCCILSCAKGVDCSGFVSRVWGVTGRYTTTSLPTISTQLTGVKSLQFGDILNLYNSHVVIFNGMENGGIDDWESTTYGSQDRVVYQYSSWTRLSGYVPYRYNGVCNTGTVSMSVTPTNVWITRGSTATFTVYGFTSDGFQGSLNLYALNLPGTTVLPGTGFYPQTINITSSYTWFPSTLRIVTNSTTPTGTRTITIQGYSGSRLLTAYVQLTVM